MTKLITISCLSIFTFALSAQGPSSNWHRPAGVGGAGQGSRTPVIGAPYAAVQTTQFQQVLPTGNQISRTEQSKVYRDSQGRTRSERTITPPASSGRQPYIEATIVDPVAGYRYLLNSSSMTAIQTPQPVPPGKTGSGAPPARPNPPSGIQTSTVSLGSQTINSVTAAGTQVTETIPAGTFGNTDTITIVRTTWISTDLKVPVEIKSSDPRSGTTDMELTNIQQTEPDPALFTVPAGYTVKTGSGAQGGFGVRAGRGGRVRQ